MYLHLQAVNTYSCPFCQPVFEVCSCCSTFFVQPSALLDGAGLFAPTIHCGNDRTWLLRLYHSRHGVLQPALLGSLAVEEDTCHAIRMLS